MCGDDVFNRVITTCEECATSHILYYRFSIISMYEEFTKSMGVFGGEEIQDITYVA